MTPSLRISQKILDRLSSKTIPNFGKVYGIVAKNNLIVLELQIETENGYNTQMINSLPAEIYHCGAVNIGDEKFNEQEVKKVVGEVYVTDNPVFINCNTESKKITANFFVNSQLEPKKFTPISEQEILSQFLYVRLRATVPLTCDANSVKESFTNLRKSIASGVMTFGFANNIFLLGGDSESAIVGVSAGTVIGDLCDESNDPSEGNLRKKKNQEKGVDVIDVEMFKRMTRDNGLVLGKEHAPVCVLDKKQSRTFNISVPIDALSIVERQLKISQIHEIIVESAIRNLRLLENTFVNSLQCLENKISQPQIFHFYPEELGHFITKIYPKNSTDDSLYCERQEMHKELLLAEERPLFRKSNSFVFKGKLQMGEPLVNPHLGLKPTDNGGKIALVKGKYTYYHYCQNKMDDNGWGCAYRSLQTLASWFKHQGYTTREVPTFQEIQKCLVDIGDKSDSFIGSKQWIGSTEVNYVLNSLLGVTSKILYVSSGDEMSTKGPELVSHFEIHGSPVMIGGGVLAHTILGVDYNSQSGSLKFLILDPHYTGSEDLYTIQSKGWCGWKGVDFWDKTAYYNMCLPQVPKGI